MTAIEFNADEIFGLAEQIERNGAAFYRKCTEMYPTAAQLFSKLADMEDAHLATFVRMHKEVSERESEKSAADPDNEAGMYLKQMAGGYVFDVKKDPSETITGKEDIKDIMNIAIGLEKDSIVFYTGIKESVRRGAGKDKIDDIIREEMKHITWISEQMKSAG